MCGQRTQNQNVAVEALQDKLFSAPNHALQRHDEKYAPHTDARNMQVHCVLLEEHKDGTDRPIGYRFRSLDDAQRA